MQQTPTMWPHFQQFLHCGTPKFMLAPHTMAIKLSMLKCLLMIFLILELFWVSYILIQIMAMSDLGKTLIILGLEVRTISLKMWLTLSIFSTLLDKILMFKCLLINRIPIILRYNLDCESLREEIWSVLVVREFLMHFSISWKLEGLAILSVMMTISLSSTWIKSVMTFDFIPLRAWFMLMTCMLESLMYQFANSLLIGMITCFLDGLFVVMFKWGFGLSLVLLIIFCTWSIFLFWRCGKVFLIFKVSSTMFEDTFVCEVNLDEDT